jgi:D-sedoheptulose 7-phosphate isomerase
MEPLKKTIDSFDLNYVLDDHINVASSMKDTIAEPFNAAVTAVVNTLKSGGKVLFCGNGGSAADCQHLATEFTVKFKKPRAALAAIALTTDTSALTAIGNDFGFEDIFSRQIEALGSTGDLLIAISTSGKSPNVLKAMSTARDFGITTVAFSGCGGAMMNELADIMLCVPSSVTARIQEMHIFLGQSLIEAVEYAYGWK